MMSESGNQESMINSNEDSQLNCTVTGQINQTNDSIGLNGIHQSDEQQSEISNQFKQQKKLCFNQFCFTQHKMGYVKFTRVRIDNHYQNLCQMCADAYKNSQFCIFCKQIYLENGVNADADGKEWIDCDKCKKWDHVDCEEKYRKKDIQQQMKQASDMNIEFHHVCLRCEETSGLNQNHIKNSKRPKKCPYYSYKKLKQEQVGYPQFDNVYESIYPHYNPQYIGSKNPFDQFNSLKGKQQHNIVDGRIMFITNKPLIPVYYDNYQFIDTLVQQYGGKKLFLTEQEIKQLQGQVLGIRVEVTQSDSNSNQNDNDNSNKYLNNQQSNQSVVLQQNQQPNSNNHGQQQTQSSQQKQPVQQNSSVPIATSENKKRNNKYKEPVRKNQEEDKNERMTRSHKAKKQ